MEKLKYHIIISLDLLFLAGKILYFYIDFTQVLSVLLNILLLVYIIYFFQKVKSIYRYLYNYFISYSLIELFILITVFFAASYNIIKFFYLFRNNHSDFEFIFNFMFAILLMIPLFMQMFIIIKLICNEIRF